MGWVYLVTGYPVSGSDFPRVSLTHPKSVDFSLEKWRQAWGFIEEGRVSNLVPADYSKGSALEQSLLMAVDSMARRIALRGRTYQG